MSPDSSGWPSSVVTMPTTSWPPLGAMTTTWSWRGSRPNDSGVRAPPCDIRTSSGATGRPNTWRLPMTMKATGCIGTRVPGGRTGRWTPFCPPPAMKPSRFEKLPNSGRNSALLAPIGSGRPTWAMTTPISPAGICTHGNFVTANTGQNRKRRPGMSRVAW